MKKLYTLLAVAAISGSAFAQRQMSTTTVIENAPALLQLNNSEMVIDTVAPVIACATPGAYLVGSSNGGYVSGTNGYQDAQKGLINGTQNAVKISSILVAYGAKESVSNGSFVAYVHNVDTTQSTLGGWLGSPIATSSPVSISNIDTSGAYTEFTFNNAPVVSGLFAILVEVDNGGDTVGIIHTNDGCGGQLAIEKWDNGTYVQMASSSSWGYDITFYMLAVTDDNISTEENILQRNSVKAFPNPATDIVNVTYFLNENAQTEVQVMDMTGRVVMSVSKSQTAGAQRVELNTSDLSAGTYFYSVRSGNNTLNGKFVKQ